MLPNQNQVAQSDVVRRKMQIERAGFGRNPYRCMIETIGLGYTSARIM